jgi:hypothetical protein
MGSYNEAEAKATPKAKSSKQLKAAGAKKCKMSLEDFAKQAAPLTVRIGDIPLMGTVKAPFSTGSFGWYVNGKTQIKVGDTLLDVQVGCNITVVGSKPE